MINHIYILKKIEIGLSRGSSLLIKMSVTTNDVQNALKHARETAAKRRAAQGRLKLAYDAKQAAENALSAAKAAHEEAEASGNNDMKIKALVLVAEATVLVANATSSVLQAQKEADDAISLAYITDGILISAIEIWQNQSGQAKSTLQ